MPFRRCICNHRGGTEAHVTGLSCVNILLSLSRSVHARAHKCTPSIKPSLCSVAMVTASAPFKFFWFLPDHVAQCDCSTYQKCKHSSLYMGYKICINVSFNRSQGKKSSAFRWMLEWWNDQGTKKNAVIRLNYCWGQFLVNWIKHDWVLYLHPFKKINIETLSSWNSQFQPEKTAGDDINVQQRQRVKGLYCVRKLSLINKAQTKVLLLVPALCSLCSKAVPRNCESVPLGFCRLFFATMVAWNAFWKALIIMVYLLNYNVGASDCMKKNPMQRPGFWHCKHLLFLYFLSINV